MPFRVFLRHWWMALVLVALPVPVMAQTATGAPALPSWTLIPEDFSTVVCPDRATSSAMFASHIVATGNSFDTDRFMSGLRATGCEQTGGPITIVEVLARRGFGPEGSFNYLHYRGRRPDGAEVFGMVHEEGFINAPRTGLERRLQVYAPQRGVLDMTTLNAMIDGRGYRCASPGAANAVTRRVSSLPRRNGAVMLRPADVQRLLRTHGCSRLRTGRFTPEAITGDISYRTGAEGFESMMSLTATGPDGRPAGLIILSVGD